MKKTITSIVVGCCLHALAVGQASDSLQLTAGNTVAVTLEKPVDARKSKVGDSVMAKTTEHVRSDGQIVIPKNSKVFGHVTVVQARSKETKESAVGIAFDRVVLKNGHEVLLAFVIQAVAPPQLSAAPVMAMGPAAAGGAIPTAGGGSMGPMSDPNAGTPGRIASPENASNDPAGTLTSSGGLTPSCHGVLGIDGLGLQPESPNVEQGSLIVSLRRNVRLDGGTQMMLRVIRK